MLTNYTFEPGHSCFSKSICGRVVKAPDSSSGQLCWREFDPHRMYFFEGWVSKKVEEQGIDPCASRMLSVRSTIWATPPLPCAHRDAQNPCSNPVMGEFFLQIAWVSSTEQNHANFSENEFLPAKLRDTNIQASTVRGTMMVSVVCGNSWGGNRGNRLFGP